MPRGCKGKLKQKSPVKPQQWPQPSSAKKAGAEVAIVGVLRDRGKIQGRAAVGPLGCCREGRRTPRMIGSPQSQTTRPAAEQMRAIPGRRI